MCLHIMIQICNNVSSHLNTFLVRCLELELCDAVVLDESGATCACLREREAAVAVVDAVRSSNASPTSSDLGRDEFVSVLHQQRGLGEGNAATMIDIDLFGSF